MTLITVGFFFPLLRYAKHCTSLSYATCNIQLDVDIIRFLIEDNVTKSDKQPKHGNELGNQTEVPPSNHVTLEMLYDVTKSQFPQKEFNRHSLLLYVFNHAKLPTKTFLN